MSKLFEDRRTCICCDRSATPRHMHPGEPTIVAISFVIYYRSSGKSILKAAPKVRICSECLAKALAEPKLWGSPESKKFLASVRESLSARYSDILEEDALNQVHRPQFTGD